MADAAGKLVIISGPSGAGKSTVVRQLIARCPLPLRLSVSATTREPRPGERHGVEYYFLSKAEFLRRIESGSFLEWKEVFGCGDYYGTLESEAMQGLQAGHWVLLEIDVEGALAVLQKHPEAITIFIHSGSPEELERRLRDRGTETETSIRRRLDVARRELQCRDRYQHQVLNDVQERAAQEICEILLSHSGGRCSCSKN
jgi:guanylate kinase